MMEHATAYLPDVVQGRWVIATRFQRRQWEVIVEPISESELLVVVTVYDVWED